MQFCQVSITVRTVKVNTNYVHKCFCKSCLYTCRGQQDIQPETRNCFHNVIGISLLRGLHILTIKRCTRSEWCNVISSPTDRCVTERKVGNTLARDALFRNASAKERILLGTEHSRFFVGGQIIRGDQSSWHYSNLEFEQDMNLKFEL